MLGTAALVLLAPLIGCIAVLVRWESPGPILYRQERIGKDGVAFGMWKFRSMRWGSNDTHHRRAAAAWFAGTPTAGGYKPESDPRITRVGRWLRRSTLDELPQLFNVLRGEMSLVGPRPAIPYELALYQPWYYERQAVKPGMTGLWQVTGRDQVSAPVMMTLDVRYVQARSLWLDLKILALTVPAVLTHLLKER